MIYKVIGRETIEDLEDAIGFTAANIPPTERRTIYAFIQAIGGDVRFCIDGTDPEDDLGVRLTQDSTVEIWGGEALRDFRVIEETNTGGRELEVIYFGRGGLA